MAILICLANLWIGKAALVFRWESWDSSTSWPLGMIPSSLTQGCTCWARGRGRFTPLRIVQLTLKKATINTNVYLALWVRQVLNLIISYFSHSPYEKSSFREVKWFLQCPLWVSGRSRMWTRIFSLYSTHSNLYTALLCWGIGGWGGAKNKGDILSALKFRKIEILTEELY